MFKICYCCKLEKEINEFYKRNGYKDGLSSYCIPCSKQKAIEWTNKNKQKNPKEYLEKANKRSLEWHQTHREESRKRAREYKVNNREKINKRRKLFRIIHPFKELSIGVNKRAREKKIEGKITPQQLFTIAKKQRLFCALSGIKLNRNNISVDHIVPLSKGGKNTIDNIQLLDITVNRLKNNLTETELFELINKILVHKKWQVK